MHLDAIERLSGYALHLDFFKNLEKLFLNDPSTTTFPLLDGLEGCDGSSSDRDDQYDVNRDHNSHGDDDDDDDAFELDHE